MATTITPTKHDESRPPVLAYARRRPDATSRLPAEAAAEDFLCGAWGATIVLAPAVLVFGGDMGLVCAAVIACGTLVSVPAAGLVALGVWIRSLVEHRKLATRSIWATLAAGVAWPLGLVAICTLSGSLWYQNRLLTALWAWALLEPLAASLLVTRRAA
jgi:hypothetical protein